MASLGARTISEKAFEGGEGAGDPPADLAEPVRLTDGAEEKWHFWKEEWPERWGKGRNSETRLKSVEVPSV